MKTLTPGIFIDKSSSRFEEFTRCLSLLETIDVQLADKYRNNPLYAKMQEVKFADLNSKEKRSFIHLTQKLASDLSKRAPVFTYFGPHPADNLLLGVWIDLNAVHKAETMGELIQAVGDKWPGKSRYVLDMSKDGLTLYRRRGKLPIWTMV